MRCNQCNKKVNIVQQTVNKCMCSQTFCDHHRMPEDHSCTADHTTLLLRHLAIQLPKIEHDKLTNRI
jgi:predicted nucleic acid binding AN1-type Zn finger protein